MSDQLDRLDRVRGSSRTYAAIECADRLAEELRENIHLFNTTRSPEKRVEAIGRIRELREKIRGAR